MLDKMKEILIEKLELDDDVEITEETSFKDDLDIDSLDLFDLVMSIEENFGVEIPSADLEEITTVGKMIDYLESHGVEA